MYEDAFLATRLGFARRLSRLAASRTRCAGFAVDDELGAIEAALTGTESVGLLLITALPADDPRIVPHMQRVGHVLADLPSAILFGTPVPSVVQRRRRYELAAALASSSGLPNCLLDGDKYAGYRFDAESRYFRSRNVPQLNEQYITVWCRRFLAPYRLNIMCLFAKFGSTTEDLLKRELGDEEPPELELE